MLESVLLTGGGSAGHVNPLLAVAEELRDRSPGTRIAALGTREGLESDLVPARGFDLEFIPRVPFPRRPGRAALAFPKRFWGAVRQTQNIIRARDVRVVLGFGGYVSTPAYVAARREGVPIVIHEQNARPGLANRLGARWAAAVAVTFPGTPLRGSRVTGLPLRAEIVHLLDRRTKDPNGARRASAEFLGLDPAAPVLLVTGGSLGALSLNTAMIGALDEIAASGVQVLHLTGRDKSDHVRGALAARSDDLESRYQVREYLDQMHEGLAVADLVLCRAGAGTVAELTALGIPAAYVPLPIGNGEQRLNAQPVIDAGGGLIIEDAALAPEWVVSMLLPLLNNRKALAGLGEAAAGVGRTEGAARVADLAEEFARGDQG